MFAPCPDQGGRESTDDLVTNATGMCEKYLVKEQMSLMGGTECGKRGERGYGTAFGPQSRLFKQQM